MLKASLKASLYNQCDNNNNNNNNKKKEFQEDSTIIFADFQRYLY